MAETREPHPEQPAETVSYRIVFEFADPRIVQLDDHFTDLALLFIEEMETNHWHIGGTNHRHEVDRVVNIIDWDARDVEPALEPRLVVERAALLLFKWFKQYGLPDLIPIYAGAKKLVAAAEEELFENYTTEATTLFAELRQLDAITTVDFD